MANRCKIYAAIKVRYIIQAYVIMIYIIDFIFCTIKQIGHVSRSLQNTRSCSTLIYYSTTTLSVTFTYFHVYSIIRYAIVNRIARRSLQRNCVQQSRCASERPKFSTNVHLKLPPATLTIIVNKLETRDSTLCARYMDPCTRVSYNFALEIL